MFGELDHSGRLEGRLVAQAEHTLKFLVHAFVQERREPPRVPLKPDSMVTMHHQVVLRDVQVQSLNQNAMPEPNVAYFLYDPNKGRLGERIANLKQNLK